MIHKSTLSRLVVLFVVGTVLMTGLAGMAAANHDVDQDADVMQEQDSDRTNNAIINAGDQTNDADQDQEGYAINYNG